jgi:hypothetical protein
MESNSNKDIAVFTFSRGSQMNDNIQNTESYQFVQRILKNMMSRYGLDAPKIGLSGSIEDVSCFIAGLIEYQLLYNVNVEYFEGDTTEYEIDMYSEEVDEELG